MTPLDDARVWLRYAEEDLVAAEAMLESPAVVPRHPAWLAQQAAEKALKAVLVADDRAFPKTHDLDKLAALLPDPSWMAGLEVDLADLTEYAVGPRYPGDLPDRVTREDARGAVQDARQIVAAARELVESGRR